MSKFTLCSSCIIVGFILATLVGKVIQDSHVVITEPPPLTEIRDKNITVHYPVKGMICIVYARHVSDATMQCNWEQKTR